MSKNNAKYIKLNAYPRMSRKCKHKFKERLRLNGVVLMQCFKCKESYTKVY